MANTTGKKSSSSDPLNFGTSASDGGNSSSAVGLPLSPTGYAPVSLPSGGGGGKNPVSTTNLENAVIKGSGAFLGTGKDVTKAQADALFAQLAQSNSGAFANLQMQLYQAGLYGTSKPTRLGVFSPSDLNAFKGLTSAAAQSSAAGNGTSLDIGQLVQSQAAANVQNGTVGVPRSLTGTDVNQINLTNPNDIAARVQNAFKSTFGRRANDGEVASFVKEIQGSEINQSATRVAHTRAGQLADANYAYDTQANDLQPAMALGSAPGSDSINAVAQQSAINPDQLSAFMQALRGNESGNNYAWRSNAQGATGAYQILAGNYPGWARQAGVDPNDHSPAAQDKVAAFQLSQYYKKYGGRWDLVAAAWQGGQGTADKIAKDPSYASRVGDVNETTQKYIDNQMSAFQRIYQASGSQSTSSLQNPDTRFSHLPPADRAAAEKQYRDSGDYAKDMASYQQQQGVASAARAGAMGDPGTGLDVSSVLGPRPQLGPLDQYTVTDPTGESGLAEEARKKNPVEAGVYGMTQQFHTLLGMLGKAV